MTFFILSAMSGITGTGGTSEKGGRDVVCSDKRKRELKKQQRRRALKNTVTRFLDNIFRKSEIGIETNLKLVRERCYQITSNLERKTPSPAPDVYGVQEFSIALFPYPDFRFQ